MALTDRNHKRVIWHVGWRGGGRLGHVLHAMLTRTAPAVQLNCSYFSCARARCLCVEAVCLAQGFVVEVHARCLAAMVIYVFEFPGNWIKMGWACRCPYERLDLGFWWNRHPDDLHGKLDDVDLLYLFEGDEATEKALHSALKADIGEFYAPGRLAEVVGLLKLTLDPLPLPPPRPPVRMQPVVKQGCCGGPGGSRPDHARRSYATKGITAPCDRCGRIVSVRRDSLKRHQRSPICRPA